MPDYSNQYSKAAENRMGPFVYDDDKHMNRGMVDCLDIDQLIEKGPC